MAFEAARVLAKKMTTLYRLAKEQLSKQYHYDFGMRGACTQQTFTALSTGHRANPFSAALKSVLVMAGSLKREFAEMPEEQVLMRSLRDSNMPKFVFDDVPLFRGLIADLFPGLDLPRGAWLCRHRRSNKPTPRYSLPCACSGLPAAQGGHRDGAGEGGHASR